MKRKGFLTSVLMIFIGCTLLANGVLAQPSQASGKGQSSAPNKSSSATKTAVHSSGKGALSNLSHAQKALPSNQSKPIVRTTNLAKGTDPLSQTRPDDPALSDKSARPLDSPVSAISDGGRMLLYLIPILGLIVGGVALARKLQTGQTIFSFSSARSKALSKGSTLGLMARLQQSLKNPLHSPSLRSLRVMESLALGNAALYLVEARGRLLLIGAAPAGVTLLKEFERGDETGFASDFHALVEASDVQGLAVPDSEIVEELDERLQEVSSKLARRAQRLRTVREVEADIE
ncbi:flagellar biosynthetic protein FliO [Chthonomonas calidirosea]|uniref:flagellar biosynthetic protein FliO n=1 Tax=Chthonomonas calidirosea TaxID=454171 RepID=UPI0006ECA426|nr:flagellar biosynthetic protein FliO [Chthonomonas calidirosea]CEK13561.1 Flagellar biosynthesis protein, FliO [Chthonomonas calidirosea]